MRRSRWLGNGGVLLGALCCVAMLLFPLAAAAQQPYAPNVSQDARTRDQLRSGQVPAPALTTRSSAAAVVTGTTVPRTKFGFAVADVTAGDDSAADTTTLKKGADAGAGWMLGWVSWSGLRATARGPYVWQNADGTYQCTNNDIDNVLHGAEAYGLGALVRLQNIPTWATSDRSGRMASLQGSALQTFAKDLAHHARVCHPSMQIAYQVFNEPNLNYEWGTTVTSSSANAYAKLLRAAYVGFKAGDRTATVVSAGLADGATYPSMSDLNYLQALYRAGVKGGTSFDAVGTHPYGGNSVPATDPNTSACSATCFRRAELQHNIMLSFGDTTTPMWATEMGWLLDPKTYGPDYNLGTAFNWMKVPAQVQADNTVAALQYAQQNWPWMARLFVFNLDHSTAMWCGTADTGYIGQCYPPTTSVYWFSALNGDTNMSSTFYRSPRLVYLELASMPKS